MGQFDETSQIYRAINPTIELKRCLQCLDIFCSTVFLILFNSLEFTCQGQCPLGQIIPLMTLGLKWIWGFPQGTLTEPERGTNKLQFGSVLDEY